MTWNYKTIREKHWGNILKKLAKKIDNKKKPDKLDNIKLRAPVQQRKQQTNETANRIGENMWERTDIQNI